MKTKILDTANKVLPYIGVFLLGAVVVSSIDVKISVGWFICLSIAYIFISKIQIGWKVINKIEVIPPDWRPIETAPTDGRWILGCNKYDITDPIICRYNLYNKWVSGVWNEILHTPSEVELSHWMPLPKIEQ